MKKKVVSMLLALVLCFTFLPSMIYAAETESGSPNEIEGATIVYEDESRIVYQDDTLGIFVEISDLNPRLRLAFANTMKLYVGWYDLIAYDTNVITANVNIGHASTNPGSLYVYIEHFSKTLASGSRKSAEFFVNPGKNVKIWGIPSGGYNVYAKPNVTGSYYYSVDDLP